MRVYGRLRVRGRRSAGRRREVQILHQKGQDTREEQSYDSGREVQHRVRDDRGRMTQEVFIITPNVLVYQLCGRKYGLPGESVHGLIYTRASANPRH